LPEKAGQHVHKGASPVPVGVEPRIEGCNFLADRLRMSKWSAQDFFAARYSSGETLIKEISRRVARAISRIAGANVNAFGPVSS
jgi:hypothetical protein